MLQKRFYLGGECETFAVPIVVERLDAQAVPGTEKRLRLLIPNGKGEHATEALDTRGSVLLKCMNDGFGIATRPVLVACPLKIGAYIGVVKNFAVIDNPDVAVLVLHRLVTAGYIDDAKTPMSQANGFFYKKTELI